MTFRFAPVLKELRLHLCQTGAKSQGARDFIKQHYVKLKESNPNFPILIRECSGVQPRLWARFENGKERSVNLTDKSAKDVFEHVREYGEQK